MADDQITNPVPWWATGGPARITVRPYQSAAGPSGDSGGSIPWAPEWGAWFPDDWVGTAAPADAAASDDHDTGAVSVPINPTKLINNPSGTRYLDPFTQFLIASLARSPAMTNAPLVSPELSNAVASALPIFPKDIFGFDPNKMALPYSEDSVFRPDSMYGYGAVETTLTRLLG